MKPLPDDRRGSFALERAREVIRHEAAALAEVEAMLDGSFARAVDILLATVSGRDEHSPGKIVVTGVGKSGLIGRKMAATFNSTGATSFFLHPVEAVHGDLGMVGKEDAVIMISRSGANSELKALLPSFHLLGVPVITITAKPSSDIALRSEVVLLIGNGSEACSLNLTPTSSAIATLAIGDALAVTLFDLRGLEEKDFARFHPGGVLGKRLLLRVEEIMHVGEAMPTVSAKADMKEVLVEIMEKRLGATCVVRQDGALDGIITDGDLKRILLRHPDLFALSASDVMSRTPKVIAPDALVADALRIMHEDRNAVIACLPVVGEGKLAGFLHMYDCLRSGAGG